MAKVWTGLFLIVVLCGVCRTQTLTADTAQSQHDSHTKPHKHTYPSPNATSAAAAGDKSAYHEESIYRRFKRQQPHFIPDYEYSVTTQYPLTESVSAANFVALPSDTGSIRTGSSSGYGTSGSESQDRANSFAPQASQDTYGSGSSAGGRGQDQGRSQSNGQQAPYPQGSSSNAQSRAGNGQSSSRQGATGNGRSEGRDQSQGGNSYGQSSYPPALSANSRSRSSSQDQQRYGNGRNNNGQGSATYGQSQSSSLGPSREQLRTGYTPSSSNGQSQSSDRGRSSYSSPSASASGSASGRGQSYDTGTTYEQDAASASQARQASINNQERTSQASNSQNTGSSSSGQSFASGRSSTYEQDAVSASQARQNSLPNHGSASQQSQGSTSRNAGSSSSGQTYPSSSNTNSYSPSSSYSTSGGSRDLASAAQDQSLGIFYPSYDTAGTSLSGQGNQASSYNQGNSGQHQQQQQQEGSGSSYPSSSSNQDQYAGSVSYPTSGQNQNQDGMSARPSSSDQSTGDYDAQERRPDLAYSQCATFIPTDPEPAASNQQAARQPPQLPLCPQPSDNVPRRLPTFVVRTEVPSPPVLNPCPAPCSPLCPSPCQAPVTASFVIRDVQPRVVYQPVIVQQPRVVYQPPKVSVDVRYVRYSTPPVMMQSQPVVYVQNDCGFGFGNCVPVQPIVYQTVSDPCTMVISAPLQFQARQTQQLHCAEPSQTQSRTTTVKVEVKTSTGYGGGRYIRDTSEVQVKHGLSVEEEVVLGSTFFCTFELADVRPPSESEHWRTARCQPVSPNHPGLSFDYMVHGTDY